MPNHINNTLSVAGDPAEVARFMDAARGIPLEPGPRNRFRAVGEVPPREMPLDFGSLNPLPSESTERSYNDFGYEAEIAAWGVKWGAYDQQDPIVEGGIATYEYTTTWGIGYDFHSIVAENWPALTFLLSYGGEGPVRGRIAFRGDAEDGSVEDDDEFAKEFPEEPDSERDEDSDAWKEYEAKPDYATHCPQVTHPLWLAHHLSGYSFDPGTGEPLRDWLIAHDHSGLAGRIAGLAGKHPGPMPRILDIGPGPNP